jgi:hypothetical protein
MSSAADQTRQQKLSTSPPGQSALAYMTEDTDAHQEPPISTSPRNGPMSAPLKHSALLPERTNFPTRATTLSSPHDLEHKKSKAADQHHAHSEDLNHNGSSRGNDSDFPVNSSSRSPFLSASRPTTPATSGNNVYLSSESLDIHKQRPSSAQSGSSDESSTNDTGPTTNTAPSTTHTSSTNITSS